MSGVTVMVLLTYCFYILIWYLQVTGICIGLPVNTGEKLMMWCVVHWL